MIINDGEIMVLGGLIEDRFRHQPKVPLLGDIPYIGALFRGETRDKKDQPDGLPAAGGAARRRVSTKLSLSATT